MQIDALYLTEFMALFAGNPNQWAKGWLKDADRRKYSWGMVKTDEVPLPLTEAEYRLHLSGTTPVGIYPLHDGKCKWACIDFDVPKADEHLYADADFDARFAAVIGDATAQLEAFIALGLFAHLERSRSGNGAHVWVFFDEWLDAHLVRAAILPRLLPSKYMDRGKIYPSDPDKSEFGVLIGLPYQPSALAYGGSAFLNPDTLEPIDLPAFLSSVLTNNAAVVRRLAADAPKTPNSRVQVAEDGTVTVTPAATWANASTGGGRPDPLYKTGILKLISPYGCGFMHHTVTNRHTIGQDEWWIAMQQLSAFERGREAAHLIWGDTKHYEPNGMNAMFDRVSRETPMGCNSIHERFPDLACSGCVKRAPYYRAQPTLLEMTADAPAQMEHGQYDDDLERIWRRDSGEMASGLDLNVEGFDGLVRFRNSELTILAAQPSMGKTAWMIWSQLMLAKQGIINFSFSGETSRDPFHDRVIAHMAEIDSRALRGERLTGPLTSDERERIKEAVARLKTIPYYENYTVSDPEMMCALIERTLLDYKHPLHAPFLIAYDYLQLGSAFTVEAHVAEHQRIAQRVYQFKALQKVLQRPVLLMSQTTRDTAEKDKDDIGMTVGAGSRVIEQAADQLLVLTGEYVPGAEAPRFLHQTKNKEGGIGGVLDMVFHQSMCHFESRAAWLRRQRPATPAAPLKDNDASQDPWADLPLAQAPADHPDA